MLHEYDNQVLIVQLSFIKMWTKLFSYFQFVMHCSLDKNNLTSHIEDEWEGRYQQGT